MNRIARSRFVLTAATLGVALYLPLAAQPQSAQSAAEEAEASAAPVSPAVPPAPPASAEAPTPPAPLPPAAGATGSDVQHDAAGNTTTVDSHLPAPATENLRAEFDRIDMDRDGAVSRQEAASDKYLTRTFAKLDADGDGRLAFDELRDWLDD